MVDRGADKRQSQGDINGASKTAVLEHRQALVMIHGQNGIAVSNSAAIKHGICRQWTVQVNAFFTQVLQCRNNGVQLLPAKMTAFTGMRVEPAHFNVRLRDPEALL